MAASRLVLIALALLFVAAPAARADTGIRFGFDANAEPKLEARADAPGDSWPGVRVVEWRACPPDGSACTPLPDGAYGGQERCAVPVRALLSRRNPWPDGAGHGLRGGLRDGRVDHH